MTHKDRKKIFGLLAGAGLSGERANVIFQQTGGRTTSLRELKQSEANDLIKWLKTQQGVGAQMEKDKEQRMVRKLLAQFHLMGWYAKDAKGMMILRAGKPVLDYTRINAWCATYTPAKKVFRSMTIKELSGAITAAEKMNNSYQMQKNG